MEPRALVIARAWRHEPHSPRGGSELGSAGFVRLVVLHRADCSRGRRLVGRYPSFRGGVAERSNASVLNTEGREPRGFESHPLRHRDAGTESDELARVGQLIGLMGSLVVRRGNSPDSARRSVVPPLAGRST